MDENPVLRVRTMLIWKLSNQQVLQTRLRKQDIIFIRTRNIYSEGKSRAKNNCSKFLLRLAAIQSSTMSHCNKNEAQFARAQAIAAATGTSLTILCRSRNIRACLRYITRCVYHAVDVYITRGGKFYFQRPIFVGANFAQPAYLHAALHLYRYRARCKKESLEDFFSRLVNGCC